MKRFSTLALIFLALAAGSSALADMKATEGILSRTSGIQDYFSAFVGFFSGQEPRAPGFWPSSASITEAHVLVGLALFSLLAVVACVVFVMLARRRHEAPATYAGTLVLALAVGLFTFRLLSWVWPLHFPGAI